MLKEAIYKKFKYILYEPSHLDNLNNLPLIVVLHGSGEVGSKLSKLRAREPYTSFRKGFNINAYVLMPQLPSGSWKKMSSELKDLIDYIVITYKCSINHISITGHSLGGAGVLEMLFKYPNYFVSAAPLSPCINSDEKDLKQITHIPLWFFYGEKEGKFGDYTKAMKTKMDKLNGNTKITCVKNKGHAIQFCWCDKEYNLFNWLIDQKEYEVSLKCKLIIEWNEEYLNDILETYYNEGYSFEEAKKVFEKWIKEDRIEHINYIIDNQLPGNWTENLEFKWGNK